MDSSSPSLCRREFLIATLIGAASLSVRSPLACANDVAAPDMAFGAASSNLDG